MVNSNINNYEIDKVYITASGGPFYFKKNVDLNKVSLKQVLKHPKWDMGKNNSIDSSNFAVEFFLTKSNASLTSTFLSLMTFFKTSLNLFEFFFMINLLLQYPLILQNHK